MTTSNKDILKLLKEEADMSLFENFDFHAGLKAEVRKNVKASRKSVNMGFFFIKLWENRIISTISVAVMIGIVVVSTMILRDSETNLPESNMPGDSNFSTFQSGGGESNLISGPNANNSWELKTKDEVSMLFNQEALLPTYNPEHYELDKIHVMGAKKENAEKVVLTFVNKELSYLVIVEKNSFQLKPTGYEMVDINGENGYLKTEGSAENINTELFWYQGDYYYMIGGLISSEEALKVARSFK